ncbi:MAG: carbon-nitrogen hydrolase family protein [Planctomycetota bacterium]
MQRRILSEMRFRGPAPGWEWPAEGMKGLEVTPGGAILSPSGGEALAIFGPGVHTRNGDAIELRFEVLEPGKGALVFGFSGGMECALLKLDFARSRASLETSDWRFPQPVASTRATAGRGKAHSLLIEKTEGRGTLVKLADLRVLLDGRLLFRLKDLNVLPEMGVQVSVRGARVRLTRFVHIGRPFEAPEYLSVGGWQTLNWKSIERNLKSIERGAREAAEAGVELLVTPETSLTGLHPTSGVTRRRRPIELAERRLRWYLSRLRNAPHIVVGLPVWERSPGSGGRLVRYNVSRVYDPGGGIVASCAKVHSCETGFWHGYRLHAFEVLGVPVSINVCHDVRYPETWTLPIMFGARLILHPACGAEPKESVEAFERRANLSIVSHHAFYVHTSGRGGSFIVGPQKLDNILAVSAECRRDNPSFPMVGKPVEGLHHARLRIHDAFGYWPVRSFRASADVARAYVELYRSRGGRCLPSQSSV